MNKQILKKSPDEIQEWLQFRHRGSKVEPRKGRGSFKRKPKHVKSSF